MLLAVYVQDLNPLGNRFLSTLVAALPVLVLFYLLVGRRWIASLAGAAGAVVAILLAWLVYKMPLDMAGWSFVHGMVFGLLPIGWTVFAAMLLYNITVETGQFTIIRRSIGALSGDARVQAVLIGFCFGAFMEGAAGAGSPVAICGAMLVGLGVPPFKAAVICLIANTSPVCYGGLGVPVLTLEGSTGISADKISIMCGHQLPFLSCLIPLYMVKTMCTWRETLPGLAGARGRRRVVRAGAVLLRHRPRLRPAAHLAPDRHLRRDLLDGRARPVPQVRLETEGRVEVPRRTRSSDAGSRQPSRAGRRPIRTRRSKPRKKSRRLLPDPASGNGRSAELPLTTRRVVVAWSPWIIMAVFLVISGFLKQEEKKAPIDLGIVNSLYTETGADAAQRGRAGLPAPEARAGGRGPRARRRAGRVRRQGRQADPGAGRPARVGASASARPRVFTFNWLTAPGTPVFLAALVSMLLLRMSRAQVGQGVPQDVLADAHSDPDDRVHARPQLRHQVRRAWTPRSAWRSPKPACCIPSSRPCSAGSASS